MTVGFWNQPRISQTRIRVRSHGAITCGVCQDRWRQLSRSPRLVLKVSHHIQGLNFGQRDFKARIHPLTHSLPHTHTHTRNDPGLTYPAYKYIQYCNCECLRHLMTLCGQLENGIWRTICLQDQWNKASATASPFTSSRCCSLKGGILKMEDNGKGGLLSLLDDIFMMNTTQQTQFADRKLSFSAWKKCAFVR